MQNLIKTKDITFKGFTIPDPPHDADLLRCVHCGLCLNHCPTYRLTSLETESPRGRIFLIKELADGKQAVNLAFEEHIGLCLNCRNCETVCPSGVRYSVLLEAARGEIVQQGKLSRGEKLIRWAVFKQLFPYPRRLDLVANATGLYQRTLQPLVRATGILKLFGRLGEAEALLPDRRLRTYKPPKPKTPAPEIEGAYRSPNPMPRPAFKTKKHVALFTGCLMRAGFANIHESTVRVLERNGYEVSVPEGQTCCAALHVHAGERDIAKEMAKQNIDMFLKEDWDAIVINAAGCGAQLKDYPELFRDDPKYFHAAEEFARRTKDVSELLFDSPLLAPSSPLPVGEGAGVRGDSAGLRGDSARLSGDSAGVRGDSARLSGDSAGVRGDSAGLRGDSAGLRDDSAGLRDDSAGLRGDSAGARTNGAPIKPAFKTKTRVTYQDACHLAHGQKVRNQPRQVLKQIGNLELVEMRASDRCCGSAGIYNVIHPEIADQLIDEKITNTADTHAEIVVTGNIGCLLQLEYGKKRAGWNGRVMHLVELLDEAYKSAEH